MNRPPFPYIGLVRLRAFNIEWLFWPPASLYSWSMAMPSVATTCLLAQKVCTEFGLTVVTVLRELQSAL